TTFDLYIEGPTQSTPFQTHPNNPFANLPISQIYQENNQDLEFSISSILQSIFILAPEGLNNLVRPFYSSTLPSYDKNTTQVQFSSCIPLPSSSLTTIQLDQPFSRPNILPSNPLPRFLQNLNPIQYF
ncbi:26374_t:CDS:1, partial [Gigaspora margarita]